ncbi:MAG: sulfite exporter TauE/SafE family protein [Crocinitomicaceae bacterium]|nr:sulfite exporter TauE/SafE family protein [Crocinitomicaceae bacterium]
MPGQNFIWLFVLLLFFAAFLYASVGHGGASGYLALMALFSFSPTVMKSSALVLNIFVSLISFYQYYKGGHFKWKLFWPFIITSIPASFLGAYITLDALIYKRILGILLIFSVLRLMGIIGRESIELRDINRKGALVFGAIIGLFSGMIGIGGGIILSPVILLLHWGNMKQTAAVSALFIFVNSVSGLSALLMNGIALDKLVYLWLLIAVAGGAAGAYFARRKFSDNLLKFLLAGVLMVASVKLLTMPE